jgi:uncharacterized protein (DUF849 family)
MKPVMIEVGLNEATTRAESPRVPIAPEEIAADILACAEAGATIIHFHARDPETGDQRTCDTALYRAAMLRVREAGCDILMYPTYAPFLSGEADPVQERFGHVLSLADDPEIGMRIGPLDMGSLNLVMASEGKLLPGADTMPLEYSVYENPVPLLRRMLEQYDARGLISAMAVFEPGHLRLAMVLRAAGFGQRATVKFILSDRWLHGPLPDPEGLSLYLRMLEAMAIADVDWFCCPSGLASQEAIDRLLDAALERGGHVRVGVGDNPLAASGASNQELVQGCVERAAKFGRAPETPASFLKRFGLA